MAEVRRYEAEDVDWGGTPPPAPGKPEPPAQMVADATLNDESETDDVPTSARQASGPRSPEERNGRLGGAPAGLQPLWLIPTVQAADEELVWESLATTQLRSHALTNPSTATFKDAARFVAFIAVETGGMPRGPRGGGGPTLPGAPLVQMAVRTMHDKPEISARVRAVFEHLRTTRPPNAAAGGAAPATAGTGKLLRVGAFRRFFVEALRVVSQGTLDAQVAEQVAECEWRAARSHSSVAGALALKAAKRAGAGGSTEGASHGAPGIPLAAFADKLLHFVILFIANGGAFAAPLERHVSRLLSYVCVCVLQLDVSDAVAASHGARQPTAKSTTSRELFSGESAGEGEARLVPQPPTASAAASAGFLPPARPWSHTGAASAAYAHTLMASRGSTGPVSTAERNAATAPQLRQVGPSAAASGASGGRLPLIVTKRHVDDFDEPDDLADATVSIGVGHFAARAQSRSAAPGQLGSSLYSSKISTDATSLRKALKAFELYAHGGPGASSKALVPRFPGDEGADHPQRAAAQSAPRTADVVSHGAGSVQLRVARSAVTHARNAGGGTRMSGASDRVSRSKSAHKASWKTGSMAMRSGNKDGDPMADADLMSGASVPSARRPRNPDVARMVSIDGLGLV